jgi:anti-sigma factor RsiW
MLSTDPNSPCGRAEDLRDYVFDEQFPQDERRAMEQHLATCGNCAQELDRLTLTSAALRTLPDREIPQRIAFVSDRVFEPSAFRRLWSSGARMGFASACVLSAALIVSAWHFSSTYRPAEVRTAVRTASVSQDEINAAVAKAVAQVRTEDAQMIQAAIQTSERKRDAEYRSQMVAIEESYMVLQKRLSGSYRMLSSSDVAGSGAGQ